MLPDKELVGFSFTFRSGLQVAAQIYSPGQWGIVLTGEGYRTSGQVLDLWAVWNLENPLSLSLGLNFEGKFDALALPVVVSGGAGQINLLERMPRSRRTGGFIVSEDVQLEARILVPGLAAGEFLSVYGMAEDVGWVVPEPSPPPAG